MPIIVKAEAVLPQKRERKERAVNQYLKPKEEYDWVSLEGGYVVLLPNGDFARLIPIDNEWQYEGSFNGTETIGRRKTLEEAFKKVDNIIYRHRKELWTKIRCRVVLDAFSSFPDRGNLL